MLNKDLVKNKLNNMQQYLREILSVLDLDITEILTNLEKVRFLERNFQLIVENMLDINLHFIRELELETDGDLKNTFITLGENKILPYEMAQKLAKIINLRNMLVHGYEKIDRERFVKDFQKNKGDFDTYILLINNILESKLDINNR